MKTKEQVQSETKYGDVFTLEKFCNEVESGGITSYDGYGYFHNGENETEINVWDDSISWDKVKDMPYVCWYNK